MNNVLRNRLHAALLASLLGATLSGAASAAENTTVSAVRVADEQAIAVDYADLNLRHSAGQDALRYRLEHAARQVCGSAEYRIAGNLRDAIRNRNCQQAAVERALDQVYSNRSEVAMLHP
jgi:UrcA family protein